MNPKYIDTNGIAELMGISLARVQGIFFAKKSIHITPEPLGKFSEYGKKPRFYWDRKTIEDWFVVWREQQTKYTARNNTGIIPNFLDQQLAGQFIRGEFVHKALKNKYKLIKLASKNTQPKSTFIRVYQDLKKL